MAFEGEDARRWVLTDAPTLAPAVDMFTRSPNGPFIDTGLTLSVESKGRVYISVDTLREMAEIAGLLETKTAEEQKLHDIAIRNEGYKDGLREGNELVERLMAISGFIASDGSGAGVPDLAIDEKPAKAAGAKSGKSDSNSDNLQKSSK